MKRLIEALRIEVEMKGARLAEAVRVWREDLGERKSMANPGATH